MLYYDTCQLEIDRSYKIHKISFSSHSTDNSYHSVYTYYKDSIVIVKYYQTLVYTTTYYTGNNGLADSCEYRVNPAYSPTISKSYFFYDSEGYLKSKRDLSLYNNRVTGLDFTDTYDYTMGNLTKVTFDPKKPSLTGKYILYTYNTSQNLINIESFMGSWLGKSNKNLLQSMYIGGSLSDFPPCANYQYTLNKEGLVETKITTPCKLPFNSKTIITYEYKVTDF